VKVSILVKVSTQEVLTVPVKHTKKFPLCTVILWRGVLVMAEDDEEEGEQRVMATKGTATQIVVLMRIN
jgi:hypothetical protein